MNQLVFIQDGRAVTDSLTVASVFDKDHDKVLRDIKSQLIKLEEAGMKEWGIANFGETQYQHSQNYQWYPKYEMTEEAFAIIAMSYTTPEAMKMKVRFLEEFKRMRQQLQSGINMEQLSPQLQLLIQIEQKQQLIEARQHETEKTISTIKETFLQRDENWRNKINGMMKGASYRLGGNYQELRRQSYAILEDRARCNLDKRLRNLVERLEAQGATKTQLKNTSRMDVIEADPKLKEIYTTIVKEFAIGTIM